MRPLCGNEWVPRTFLTNESLQVAGVGFTVIYFLLQHKLYAKTQRIFRATEINDWWCD